MKNAKDENIFLSSIACTIDDFNDNINEILKEINISKNKVPEKGELYYVYAYTPQKIYITKQKSDKLEILEGVSDEFKKSLAEGFVLRYKDGEYSIDEKLTQKSMNFELDFDNYQE